jgi:hypothetical protein
MTVVSAQWALYGQPPGTDGQRVLACSSGDLSVANFTDAIGRFQLGHLDNLPQVAVSYLRPAAQPEDSYVALTLHGKSDTRYFCVPYRPLAAEAVTYHAIYQAVRGIQLPAGSKRPLPVEISQAPYGPTLDPLAMRVAALLLTSTPVCVLNAEETAVDERLTFTDWVMTLLPHGFRARMAAATWTRATFRDHKFRLYFSAAPRQGDHVVHWGQPDRVVLPDGPASDYFGHLVRAGSRLAQLAGPAESAADLRFDGKAATRALDLISPQPVTGPTATAAFSRSPDSLNAIELIDLIGREGYGRPRDFRIACDALLGRLKEPLRRNRPQPVRRALRKHGFLAGVLQANESGNEEYQVRTLHEFLLAAYPARKPAILQVLTGAGSMPTPALLAAVCLCLSSREDVEFAQRAYIHGSITRMGIDASTYVRLAPYIPDLGDADADGEETDR